MLGAPPAHPVIVGLGVGSGPRGMPGRAGVGGTPGGGGKRAGAAGAAGGRSMLGGSRVGLGDVGVLRVGEG